MKHLFKHPAVLLVLFMFLGLTLSLAACGNEPPATAVAVVEPTDTAVPPTATTAPTETPAPTDTPEPTDTPIPTETATNTPEPTHTPTKTPTNTPEPTDTPAATDTPAPSSTPRPTNTAVATSPPAATATPSPTATTEGEEAEEEFVTVYYISNPNDILGVFPKGPFDADGLRNNMVTIQSALNTMRANIDAAKAGDTAACANYVSAYNNVLYSGEFYNDVPAHWEDIDFVYFLSFIYALDRTRPAYLACVNGGDMGDFNYGLALTAINQTLEFLNPAIISANSR